MIEVPLTQGKVALIDDEDADEVLARKWHAKRSPNTWYAGTNIWNGQRYRWVSMHRFILDPPAGLVTDHIDSDGLNNQRANLRICTHSQNLQNRRAFGRSRFLGVAFDDSSTASRPWAATIGYRRIGRFRTEEEAAAAYDRAAKELYGEFARLNHPDWQKEASEV